MTTTYSLLYSVAFCLGTLITFIVFITFFFSEQSPPLKDFFERLFLKKRHYYSSDLAKKLAIARNPKILILEGFPCVSRNEELGLVCRQIDFVVIATGGILAVSLCKKAEAELALLLQTHQQAQCLSKLIKQLTGLDLPALPIVCFPDPIFSHKAHYRNLPIITHTDKLMVLLERLQTTSRIKPDMVLFIHTQLISYASRL
jgi:hypothetical protein